MGYAAIARTPSDGRIRTPPRAPDRMSIVRRLILSVSSSVSAMNAVVRLSVSGSVCW